MKRFIIYLLTIAFYQTSFAIGPVFAGGESSGGGGSIFCPNSELPEEISTLYDFFEGRIRYDLNIPVTNSISMEDQIENALQKLEQIDFGTAQDVRDEYLSLSSSIYFLPDGIIMAPVTDLGNNEAPIVPIGCNLVYAGYFETSKQVTISKFLFDNFTETEKAGLLVHEAIYSLARKSTGQDNSRSTRILNSFLFSTESNLNDRVHEALRTLNYFDSDIKVINIQTNGSNFEFQIKGKCFGSSNGELSWGADATYWSSVTGESGSYQGAASPRISVKNSQQLDQDTMVFDENTKLISFKSVWAYATGQCDVNDLEIYYSGQKVAQLPDADFAIRVH